MIDFLFNLFNSLFFILFIFIIIRNIVLLRFLQILKILIKKNKLFILFYFLSLLEFENIIPKLHQHFQIFSIKLFQ
jgi:hypothetical protein